MYIYIYRGHRVQECEMVLWKVSKTAQHLYSQKEL